MRFRTIVLLALSAVAYAGWRLVRAARESLRHLPRRNEDMALF